MNHKKIRVGGMSCAHCADGVRRTLEALASGLQVDVDLSQGWAILSGPELPADEVLREALARKGFSLEADSHV